MAKRQHPVKYSALAGATMLGTGKIDKIKYPKVKYPKRIDPIPKGGYSPKKKGTVTEGPSYTPDYTGAKFIKTK